LVSPFKELLSDSWKTLRKIVVPVSGSHAPEIAYFNDPDRMVTGVPIIWGGF
jgi:hypothetical protein